MVMMVMVVKVVMGDGGDHDNGGYAFSPENELESF